MVSWPQALRALMFDSSFSTWVLLVYLKLKLCTAFFLLFSSAIARMLGCALNSFPKLCSFKMSCTSSTMWTKYGTCREWGEEKNSENVANKFALTATLKFVLFRFLNKVLYRETARSPTPSPSIYHFWQKRQPFRIRSIDKWYPFHISSYYKNFASFLTAVNAMFLKYE